MVTENMYFPFLVCEAKCGEQGINRADRQIAHSSSIAVNAIIQLHRAVGSALQLSGQILVFSISHENERVKIYGHYAVVEGEKTSFYRYPIDTFNLNFHNGRDHERGNDFTREVYRKVFPQHLAILRKALAKLDDPRTLSMTSDMSLEEVESQETDVGAASSQDDLGFRKPELPASKKQKGEITLLRDQLAQQERQNKEQTAQLERLYKEQMAQQEKQYKEQMAQQEKQNKEQTEMLKQLLNRS